MRHLTHFPTLAAALLLAACGGGGGGPALHPPGAVTAALDFVQVKTLRFTWDDVPGATHYRLLEDPDGSSGFQPVSGDIPAGEQQYDHTVPLHRRLNARYIVQSCNSSGCSDSAPLYVDATIREAVGYFKGNYVSGENAGGRFGHALAVSADGSTLAVGRWGNDLGNVPGEVHIFQRQPAGWSMQARLRLDPPVQNYPGLEYMFGAAVALSADGNTLAVGTRYGPVYLYRRTDSQSSWSLEDTVIGANTQPNNDRFGDAVALSADGNVLAVGAPREASAGNGPDDNSAPFAGATYVFVHTGGNWSQHAYIKPANTGAGDRFGTTVALSADGDTLIVGAPGEDGMSAGINGDPDTNGTVDSGAVYVFQRGVFNLYLQQAYIKASNPDADDRFGSAVALSADGDTLAVGAPFEDSSGDGGNDADNAGAVYVFTRSGTDWSQQAYVKAAITDPDDRFGSAVALSADGDTLLIGAPFEDSGARGLFAASDTDNTHPDSGASYLFARDTADTWSQQIYLKATNTDTDDRFGDAVTLAADGDTLIIGAPREASDGAELSADPNDNSALNEAGAVYLY